VIAEENPADLLKPYPADVMTMWSVSPRVNSVKNDAPELLERIKENQDATGEVERVNEAGADAAANSE
jgi:hypothetical protein